MKGKVIIISLVLLISLIIGGLVFADADEEVNYQNETEQYQAQVRTREDRKDVNCEDCDEEGEQLRVQRNFNRSRKLEEGINGQKRQQMNQYRKHQWGQ